MKNSRLCLLVLTGLTLSLSPVLRAGDAASSPGGERREKFQQNAERMAEVLGLTEAQKTQFKAIQQQEKAELDAIRSNDALSKQDRRAQSKEIHQKYRDQRHSLLTPEQRTKADSMRGKMEKRRDRMERDDKAGN